MEVCGSAFAFYSQELDLGVVGFVFGFFCAFVVAFFVAFFVAFVVSVFVGCASVFVCFVFQVGVWPPFSLCICFVLGLIRCY